MNLFRQPLALLLAATFLTVVSGCTTVQRVDAPRTQMTVSQARKSLAENLSRVYFNKAVREVKFSRHHVNFIADGIENGMPYEGSVAFAEMTSLSVVSGEYLGRVVRSNGKDIYLGQGCRFVIFGSSQDAMKFAAALLILNEAALAPDTEEADLAAFTTEAKTWLAANPKPEMSEEARTFKVLAEDAFERKDFTAALDAYCSALDKYPMWRKGQYNAAILAAEAEDYELAAQHMRRYLVLSPDAKDAASAKDKLLLWQHKAKE